MHKSIKSHFPHKLRWHLNASYILKSSTFQVLLPRLLPNLAVYMSNTRVSYKKQEPFTFREHPDFCGVCHAHLFFFVCCPVMSSEFHVVVSITISA